LRLLFRSQPLLFGLQPLLIAFQNQPTGPGNYRNGIPLQKLLDAMDTREIPFVRSDMPPKSPKGIFTVLAVLGEIRAGGRVWDVEFGGTVCVLVADCQRPQSRARLKPETMTVTR
jgi:hypothetical protein